MQDTTDVLDQLSIILLIKVLVQVTHTSHYNNISFLLILKLFFSEMYYKTVQLLYCCQDPMIPECDAAATPMTPISARACAASSPAGHESAHQNQPHPLDKILAGPGADPGVEVEDESGQDSEATLSVQRNALVTPCTLDQSVITSSNIGPHPSEEVDASAARTAFSGIMVSTNLVIVTAVLLQQSIKWDITYLFLTLHLIKMLLDIGIHKQSLNQ